MKQNDINYSIAGYSVIEELANGMISFVVSFFERIKKEQEKIAMENARKHEMQNQLYQDTIDRLPLELKFRLGEPRN